MHYSNAWAVENLGEWAHINSQRINKDTFSRPGQLY
jgi:hypothetical protein